MHHCRLKGVGKCEDFIFVQLGEIYDEEKRAFPSERYFLWKVMKHFEVFRPNKKRGKRISDLRLNLEIYFAISKLIFRDFVVEEDKNFNQVFIRFIDLLKVFRIDKERFFFISLEIEIEVKVLSDFLFTTKLSRLLSSLRSCFKLASNFLSYSASCFIKRVKQETKIFHFLFCLLRLK
jgi:hypothetical protein